MLHAGASSFEWRKKPRHVILSAVVVTLSEAKGLFLWVGMLRFDDSSLRSERLGDRHDATFLGMHPTSRYRLSNVLKGTVPVH